MKYIDSGSRTAPEALGFWFERVLAGEDVVEVRWQSGFYSSGGLGFLVATLDRLRDTGGTVNVLIGSNDGATLRSDIERLLPLMGIPRTGAQLGIVSFDGAFFHPKTYHFTREDGSQVAYVGSANLTPAGIGALHVEAGVILDTREGDDSSVLADIRTGIDQWFADVTRVGLTRVESSTILSDLVSQGVLAEQAPPRLRRLVTGDGSAGVSRRPRLRSLIEVPTWANLSAPPAASGTAEIEENTDLDTDLESDDPNGSSAVEWDLVWRSKGLSERDLTIPSGGNTNQTGSIGLKKGNWDEQIDHRHYFRDEVFSGLQWSVDTRKSTREVTTAMFDVWIAGQFACGTALTISHNTDTSSKTYRQKNEMTHLRWGEARQWVARRSLLGSVLTLFRERNPRGAPRFRISIDP